MNGERFEWKERPFRWSYDWDWDYPDWYRGTYKGGWDYKDPYEERMYSVWYYDEDGEEQVQEAFGYEFFSAIGYFLMENPHLTYSHIVAVDPVDECTEKSVH